MDTKSIYYLVVGILLGILISIGIGPFVPRLFVPKL